MDLVMGHKIRTMEADIIEKAVYTLFLSAGQSPNHEIIDAIKKAEKQETNPTAKKILSQIIKNKKISDDKGIPYCQDTGLAVVFLDIGQDVHMVGDLDSAVNRGVRDAYRDGYFRKSVADPITRKNTGDNTPAIIHKNIVPGDKIKISVMAKGFGSENMSALKMLKPSEGIDGIRAFVIEQIKKVGGSPCPPVILGIGIGGTMERAAMLAKTQLLRPVEDQNQDETIAKLEKQIKNDVNGLGMGAMGFPGDIYCLAVKIGTFPTHIAGLPVAMNINCHAARHLETEI